MNSFETISRYIEQHYKDDLKVFAYDFMEFAFTTLNQACQDNKYQEMISIELSEIILSKMNTEVQENREYVENERWFFSMAW